MATDKQIVDLANSVTDVCTALKRYKKNADEVLSDNTTRSIVWTDAATEAVLAAANIDYTGEQISNALGSMNTFNTGFWDTGNGTNIEVVTEPIS